jgi:hypothetical protein
MHNQLSPTQLALRYAAFAVLAITANIGTQWIVLTIFYDQYPLVIAIIMGTGTGLVVKYVLDKRWIFFDRSKNLLDQGRKFTLYTLTGVGTTLIFWLTEGIFYYVFDSRHMLLIGAAVGLIMGYSIKYQLDRRLVFS